MTQAPSNSPTGTMLLAVLAAIGVAWWLLLAAPPIAEMFVCGPDGYEPAGGPWNVGRLVALTGMWSTMAVAMMLPAGVLSLVRADVCGHFVFSHTVAPPSVLPDISPSRGEIDSERTLAFPSTSNMKRGVRLSPISPLEGEMSGRTEGGVASTDLADRNLFPARYLLGYLIFLAVISIAAAIGQWTLESAGLMREDGRIASPMAAGTLLAAIGIWHVSQLLRRQMPCGGVAGTGKATLLDGWRHGCSSLGCCLTMAGLQFVGGAMNIGLMIGLTLWMLLETVLPSKRHLSAATGLALLTAGSMTIAGAMG